MDFQTIEYAVEDGIATVTLNRPAKLNAFTATMANEIIAALDLIDGDDAVRVAIFTGAGRAFCAGADLEAGVSAFDPATWPNSPVRPDGTIDYAAAGARDGGGTVTLRIHQSLKPIIGAINGAAVGIGATMTLAMDIRLASETAKIGFVFAKRGIVPEAASSYFLPRIVGISQALEWCYTGRIFLAPEAKEGGLVRSVHAADDLLPAARALAREIASGTAPVSVALIRQMMWRGLAMNHPMEAHRLDSRMLLARTSSDDVAEGVSSFFEKRPAAFPDLVSSDMPQFYPWWDEPNYR
ncbi:MAG: crotonase/enoyl-CoA hydratase family protein [Pseudomonadota bacterium]